MRNCTYCSMMKQYIKRSSKMVKSLVFSGKQSHMCSIFQCQGKTKSVAGVGDKLSHLFNRDKKTCLLQLKNWDEEGFSYSHVTMVSKDVLPNSIYCLFTMSSLENQRFVKGSHSYHHINKHLFILQLQSEFMQNKFVRKCSLRLEFSRHSDKHFMINR